MTKDSSKTAKRLLYLRRQAINDIKSYESQLKQMSKEYKIDIDLDKDKVKYKEKPNEDITS